MADYLKIRQAYNDELYHHGIKGQKWGVRRFQNEDGSLTPEGKKEATRNMLSARDTHNANTSKGRRFGAALLVGLKGESDRSVYDISRASGEGKIKSALRSTFDIRKSDIMNVPLSVLIGAGGAALGKKYGFNINSEKNKARLMAIARLATTAVDIGVTSHEHKKGRAATLQERALRNKYYSKKS